jgi:hypothetical protein
VTSDAFRAEINHENVEIVCTVTAEAFIFSGALPITVLKPMRHLLPGLSGLREAYSNFLDPEFDRILGG